jgi:hypothetical protein
MVFLGTKSGFQYAARPRTMFGMMTQTDAEIASQAKMLIMPIA